MRAYSALRFLDSHIYLCRLFVYKEGRVFFGNWLTLIQNNRPGGGVMLTLARNVPTYIMLARVSISLEFRINPWISV